MAPIPNHLHDLLVTRRSIFIGSAASVIYAPAVVRAATLMPVRALKGPIGPQYAGFVELCVPKTLSVLIGEGIT
jgi:hypothetical protein